MSIPRVFISMGTPYNEESTHFRDALETFLRDQCGVDPRIIGKNEYPSGNPLSKIKDVMRECSGVIIVAYERKYVTSGSERRNSSTPRRILDAAFTTPWNHIESALAYSLELPLYIICQKGLSEEGLIETKLDWYVQYLDITPAALTDRSVVQSLQSWVDSRVKTRSRAPRMLRTIEGSIRLSEMTPKEIIGMFAMMSGAFALGIAVARAFPSIFV